MKHVKGNSHALGVLYDWVVLSTVEVCLNCESARDFYENGTKIPVNNLLSVGLNREDGVLDAWRALVHTTLEERAANPPTSGQKEDLVGITRELGERMGYLLMQEDSTLGENRSVSEFFSYEHFADDFCADSGCVGFHWSYWNLVWIALELRVCEIKIMLKNRKEWPDPHYFVPLCDVMLDNHRTGEWIKMVDSFLLGKQNPVWALGMCDKFLNGCQADFPMAFRYGQSPHVRVDIAVYDALQIEWKLQMGAADTGMAWSPGRHYEQACENVKILLADIFMREANNAASGSESRRKWLEANAELECHWEIDSDPIDSQAAKRIVDLANKAARERWIEHRQQAGDSNFDAANSFRQVTGKTLVVKLDAKQLGVLTASRKSGIDELKSHVTAETDREIAAKAPKRKRKFGKEGNGLKGPRTRMMQTQRRIFDCYLKDHPEDEKHSRISRAHQCWTLHNEWNKAAMAVGEAKGYANHKVLAAAK